LVRDLPGAFGRGCIESSYETARLEEEVERSREQSNMLTSGEEFASILRKVREIEMTRGMVGWINSPGLQPPS
jgi:hypothetical protein